MVDVQQLRTHRETWHTFTGLIKFGMITVIIVVVLMAIFLV